MIIFALMKGTEKAPAVGSIIRERLKQTGMSQAELAQKVNEHSQTLSSVIRGTRALTVSLSLRLDAVLGFDPGTLAVAQTRYQVEREQERARKQLLQSQIRSILKKIKANGGLWSYDGIPDNMDEDAIIEAALMHLDLEDMPSLFKIWSRSHIKKVWKERMVSQGARLGILNYILAVKIFYVNNPNHYLSRYAYV